MPQDATDLFLALTPEKVFDAVETAGLRCRPVCYALNSFENRVYEVELDEPDPSMPSGYRRVIAKFYRPGRWSREQILEEHAFLRELVEEDVRVCPVLPFPSADESSEETLRTIEGIHFCLFERRGGRNPDELDDLTAARLGMFVARMHNVAARRDAPSRQRLDADTYVRRELAWLQLYDGPGRPPRLLLERYADAANELADIAAREMEGVPVHRLHGDLHLGNIFLRDGELRVYDFDDMVVGPAVQDLWLALSGRDPEILRLRAVFLESYERLRLFDRSTLRLIEPLRGLRMVRYTAWLTHRWHDPAFRLAWPQFGTEEYWQRETDDLEEQLVEIRRGAATLPEAGAAALRAVEVEEPLTNKDYFWDWEGD